MALQRWWQSDHLHMKNWRGKVEILSAQFNLDKIISESNPAALQEIFGCRAQRNAKIFIEGGICTKCGRKHSTFVCFLLLMDILVNQK